jgi:hypothetical protein
MTPVWTRSIEEDPMRRALIALALAVLAAPAAAGCYTVFQKNMIVYRSGVAPIDLSKEIHVELGKRFPGGQLVISDDLRSCTYIGPGSPVDPTTGAAPSAPGSERAGLSVVATPRLPAGVQAGMPDSTPDGTVDASCRRGGTFDRRGMPCPDTAVVGERVVGAQEGVAVPVAPERRVVTEGERMIGAREGVATPAAPERRAAPGGRR